MPYLLNRRRPWEDKTKKHDEEERPPKIPIPQSLSWVLAIRVRENDQLQVAHNPWQIPFHCVPHRLRQRIGRGSKSARANARVVIACRWQRRRRGESWRLLVGGRWWNIGWHERGWWDGDRGSRRAGWSGRKDSGGTRLDAGVDEVLDLIDIRLGRRVERYCVAVRHSPGNRFITFFSLFPGKSIGKLDLVGHYVVGKERDQRARELERNEGIRWLGIERTEINIFRVCVWVSGPGIELLGCLLAL